MTYMSAERQRALKLAAIVLDRPHGDPDDDLAVLARQLNRAQAQVERLHSANESLRALLRDIDLWGAKVNDDDDYLNGDSERNPGDGRDHLDELLNRVSAAIAVASQ